jgi:hypothetical protein
VLDIHGSRVGYGMQGASAYSDLLIWRALFGQPWGSIGVVLDLDDDLCSGILPIVSGGPR